MKSNLSRALVLALMVAVPAMAAIPPSVTVRIGGAEELGLYHFQVREGDLISISAAANPGDAMWVVAFPIQPTGEIDYSIGALLMWDRRAATGTVASDFEVPKELAAKSFAIVAFAQSADAKLPAQSTEYRVDVLERVEITPAK
jgi:hypothetical protein